ANPLHPADPLARARHRAWIEFGSAILNAIGRFYSAPTEGAFLAESKALSAMFDRLEAELAAGRAGPWFAGERFSLVDAVYAPIFRYFDAFDRIGTFGILSGKPRVEAWRKRLHERQSVKDAVTPDYPQRLHAFLQAKGSHLSKLIRRNEAATALP
ncbi:MAG: glutathione S-transferase domain-containing protein, partial [Mesorhizobium sp.]